MEKKEDGKFRFVMMQDAKEEPEEDDCSDWI